MHGRPADPLNGRRSSITHGILLFVALTLAIWGYYWFEWRTFQGFVEAIDHHPQFMQDFVGFYYPMGKQLLQVPAPAGGYFYSSFFAVLLVPIGALTLPSAMKVWGSIQVLGFVAICLIPARGLLKLSGRSTILFMALCATSYPLLNNLKWGQVSVFVTVCIAGAVVAADNRRSVLAGILLALAAAIKFYPAVFVVYFLLRRDVRACVSFALAACIFYVVVPASVLGFSNWLRFETTILDMLGRAGLAARDTNSQYLMRVVQRWLGGLIPVTTGGPFARGLVWLGYAIAASAFAMAWVLQRRDRCSGRELSAVAIFVTIPFLVKTSWPHYFAYLPMCQAAVLSHAYSHVGLSRHSGKVLMALSVLSMALSSTFLLNCFTSWEPYNSSGMLFLSNFALLMAVYRAGLIDPGLLS